MLVAKKAPQGTLENTLLWNAPESPANHFCPAPRVSDRKSGISSRNTLPEKDIKAFQCETQW